MDLGSLISVSATGLAIWVALWWQRTRSATARRRQVEDALKYLFELEYRSRRGSLGALADALRLSPRAAATLVGRMQEQLLVTVNGDALALTKEGSRLALQIVRAHRLLERYFADEAGLPLVHVHAAAERLEHTVSPAAINRLSAALGHPRLDPHGDPIPTREGAVAPPRGTPAPALPPGTAGRIVHLEDEPPIAFAQILAEGLRLGQVLRIIEVSPARVVMSDGENEYTLAPSVAANVFLAEAPSAAVDPDLRRLSDLARGELAEVVGLDESCRGFSRRRLMDLGFTAGARVTPTLQTFAGDPRAYEIRGTLIALRQPQASQVLVRAVSHRPAGDPVREERVS